MIIAEYTIDHPFLRQTFERVPDVELAWEDSYTDPEGRMRLIAWVDCEDYEAFDAAVADDPTASDPTTLTEAGSRRLYRFDLEGEGADASLMPLLMEVGAVQLDAVATGDGWRNRARFPSHEAFERVYRFCVDHDIDFEFEKIYERSTLGAKGGPELSAPQRETLLEAVESGYLDIPRRSSLDDLADRLGVSQSAASERFRRGVKKLVEETLPDDDSVLPDDESEPS